MVYGARDCNQLTSLRDHGAEAVPLFIAYGQRSEDMAVFLYSTLDVEVHHAFFLDMWGEFNMKNFQRFESKALTQSLTVLNSIVRTVEAVGYESLKCLILVSCEIVKFTVEGAKCLEVLDIRLNRLEELPAGIGRCKNLRTLRVAHNNLKSLPPELIELNGVLTTLEAGHNNLKRLPACISKISSLKVLQCHSNGLLELPVDIGLLSNLEELTVKNNKLSQLPLSISALDKLGHISFHGNPLQNIPGDFPERTSEVRQYLKSLQDDPVPNRTVKLVLVGQEGVGKSTLLKSIKKGLWVLPKTPQVEKTEGINVKEIKLKDMTLRCFDCGGDVDFNETHNFFITQGALYLACFNLSEYCLSTVERNSFLLGRLQLWLQYIFTKVPNSQIIIVGTHADHESLKPTVLEEIWKQVKRLLHTAQIHHRKYYSGTDHVKDCLLCDGKLHNLKRVVGSGRTGYVRIENNNNEGQGHPTENGSKESQNIAFPHVLGYYEVSNKKAMGGNVFDITSNPSLEHLKKHIVDTARCLVKGNPEVPRKWANVQESLQKHIEVRPEECVVTLDDVAKLAKVQGVKKRTDLVNMLHFLKAQGSVLYFPNEPDLQEMVILDPEWLAKIFSKVVSFKDTGISEEGFIDTEQLKEHWNNVHPSVIEKIISILHHFRLCMAVEGTKKELFPCKLPLGEPDDPVWPSIPEHGEKQLTYSVTFPTMIPPPLFNDLIVHVYQHRVHLPEKDQETSKYFSNQIFELLKIDVAGCRDCQENPLKMIEKETKTLIHRVHFEMIPHKRCIQITTRGQHPCCMMRKVQEMLNSMAGRFEGLGTVDLDTLLCPGCYMQRNKTPHKMSARALIQEYKQGEHVICPNAHILPDGRGVLEGIIKESCLPAGTIKPRDMKSYEEDFTGCPKLFVVLPVNRDGLSFDSNVKLFVSSLLMDGHAAHLLCEFPDGYHLTGAPGYRLRKPEEFMKQYGSHVLTVLRLMEHVMESTVVSPRYSTHTRSVICTIEDIINDYKSRFPSMKEMFKSNHKGTAEDTISEINKMAPKIRREDLRQHFHLVDSASKFGPLRRLKYGDQHLWLCSDHFKQLRVVTIGSTDRYVESSA